MTVGPSAIHRARRWAPPAASSRPTCDAPGLRCGAPAVAAVRDSDLIAGADRMLVALRFLDVRTFRDGYEAAASTLSPLSLARSR
jgi:hypothetical protein